MRIGTLVLASTLLASGCADSGRYASAVCALVDVSGTYAEETASVARIVNSGILPSLLPGDSLFLIAIDSDSYDEDNLKASVTLDPRPSRANAQKLGFARQMESFVETAERSQFTDISGAIMLCGDYLEGTGAGTEVILVFSDLQEELPPGVNREFPADELDGVDVVPMNVIKLRADNVEPAAYRGRLKAWEKKVLAAGGRRFQVAVDATKLEEFLHPYG